LHKKSFLFGLILLLIGIYTHADTLKVGMELTYPPFEMVDKEGKPAGFSVDLAHALGAFLHQNVNIENIPFSGLILALKCGKIDLIISSLAITEERKSSIDFSDPYLKIAICMLVPINSQIQNIEELNHSGKKVVVKLGTTGQIYAQNHLKAAEILVLDSVANCVLEVAQNKVDAFIYDQLTIYSSWQKNLQTTKALFTPISFECYAMGIQKGNEQLLQKVNRFLKEFRKNKGFEQLIDKYLKDQNPFFNEANIYSSCDQ
jgi:polar amino acid transport system substrate-binding protein